MTPTLAQSGSGWLGSVTSTQSPASRPKMCLACAPSWSPWNNPRWSVRQADLLGVKLYYPYVNIHYPTHLLLSHHRLNSEDSWTSAPSLFLVLLWKIMVPPSSESSKQDRRKNPWSTSSIFPTFEWFSLTVLGIPSSDVSFCSFKSRSQPVESLTLGELGH